MATSADGTPPVGLEALHRLKDTESPHFISQSAELAQLARLASQHLFSALRPSTPKCPFDRLLTEGFDAEQIWQQIDLQSQALISKSGRAVRKFEKNPELVAKQFGVTKSKKSEVLDLGRENGDVERNTDDFEGLEDEELDVFDDEDEDADEDESGEETVKKNGGEDKAEEEGDGGVEDKFLKIKELEEYLEDDEAREYGLTRRKGRKRVSDEEEDEEGEVDAEEDEEDSELGIFGLDNGEDDEGGTNLDNARYEDFFGAKKGSVLQKSKSELSDESDDSDVFDDKDFNNQKGNLSSYEKLRQKKLLEIEEMEKANLEPKSWTMQGEVTAAKRPKNSALEVDLDFDHNVRPAPVITEEVTASLEELIQKRIREGKFDDVQKALVLPSKAPKEMKELDESKSQKGLAEIYEEEYVQRTGLVSTVLPFSDEQKKEATALFKKLCLKLDALSHFHFTPKPVIEDMSVQADVPALAMEEIAPMAVSDVAMIAPEEVFAGKGDIKEEAELTQEEKKRRRAKKKRKYRRNHPPETVIVGRDVKVEAASTEGKAMKIRKFNT